jgi:hypothetical protein
MSYAMLPALRVKDAAEKALLEVDSIGNSSNGSRDDEKSSLYMGLVGLCRAVLADPKGDHDIAVDATDFTWIKKHYDFTDPRLITLHEHTSTARASGK